MPDEVRDWLLLRRAGLSKEQTTLEISQLGVNLMFKRVAVVLQSTFAQQQVMTDRMARTPAVYWTNEKENDHAHREFHDTLWTDDNPEDEWWYDYPHDFYHDGPEDEDVHDDRSNDDWNDSQPGSTQHDVEEHDKVFSAYSDAPVDERRLARGFYSLAPPGPIPTRLRAVKNGSQDQEERGAEMARGKLAKETEERRKR